MANRGPSVAELSQRARDNGFEPNTHEESDNQYDQGRHVAKTIRDQDRTLDRYIAYWLLVSADTPGLSVSPAPIEAAVRAHHLGWGAEAPLLTTSKDFIRFYISVSRPRIAQVPTVDSINTVAEWFFAGFTRVTGTPTDAKERSEVYRWVRITLVKEGLVVNKKREKNNFGEHDATRLLRAAWTKDDLIYIPERYRIQFTYIFNVYCWTGARIGAFFKGGGLRYRDVQLALQRGRDGDGWKLIYKIDQRWVKNNRDPENIVFGAAGRESDQLVWNDGGFLVAMALADKALWGYDSVEELLKQKIPAGEDVLPLRWDDSALTRPILRKCTKAGGISDEPMPISAFISIFKTTLQNAGYLTFTSIHAIRRQLGKKVDERYTEVQRSQHLTQGDPKVFGQDYVALCSSVDGQAAFRGKQADHRHVEYFQGVSKFREEGLPCKLPARLEEELKQDLMIRDHTSRIHTAISEDAKREAKRGLANTMRIERRLRLKSYQEQWIKERRDWKVKTRGEQAPNNPSNSDFVRDISIWMPERARLAQSMKLDSPLTSDKMWLAVQDLYSLCTNEQIVLYLPQIAPIDGACPVKTCQKPIESIPKGQRHQHIYKCVQKDMGARLGCLKSDVRYCNHCFTWVVGKEWDPHCRQHLLSLASKRCGVVVRCHTLVRPAYCPFCLGDSSVASSERMGSWARDHDLWKHLVSHLERQRYPATCPHPLCVQSLEDNAALRFHLVDDHGISSSGATKCAGPESGPCPKRKSTADNWMPAESLKTCTLRFAPSKKSRQTPNTICPLLIESTSQDYLCLEQLDMDLDQEELWQADLSDMSTCVDSNAELDTDAETSIRLSPPADETIEDDIFTAFVQSPFTDYSAETILKTESGPISSQCLPLPEKGDFSNVSRGGKQKSYPRLYLRLQPPKAKITLRLTKPKEEKAKSKGRKAKRNPSQKKSTTDSTGHKQQRGNAKRS